jgi:tubulin polyglutamylase TTLL6/13
MISVQPVLAHNYRSCQPDNLQNNMCFEVLGFDVMLDAELRPVLLEVNYTPSFTTDTPLDLQIKQHLLRDTLVLMNLSNRAKHDTLSTKKREMMERTLTGKKIWHSK